MPNDNNQKLKLLFLLKIMQEKTDDEHGLSSADIIQLLSEYGIKVEALLIALVKRLAPYIISTIV